MSNDTTAEVNPRYRRHIRRLGELIERGNELAQPSQFAANSGRRGGAHFANDQASETYAGWRLNCEHLLTSLFGEESVTIQRFLHPKMTFDRMFLRKQVSILSAALEDLRGGFLIGQEFIVAGVVFDEVLQEAKHLQQAGHKDAAAVLGRTVLEDALRRLARSAEVDATGKVSGVNDRLKEVGLLTQPRWRGVRTMLDVGNAAAHGEFDQYDHSDVAKMLGDVEAFLASEFHA